MENSMKNYMATYAFEPIGVGFLAKLTKNGSPVAVYDRKGSLTEIINGFCLPVQEVVPIMIERCLAS